MFVSPMPIFFINFATGFIFGRYSILSFVIFVSSIIKSFLCLHQFTGLKSSKFEETPTEEVQIGAASSSPILRLLRQSSLECSYQKDGRIHAPSPAGWLAGLGGRKATIN